MFSLLAGIVVEKFFATRCIAVSKITPDFLQKLHETAVVQKEKL